MFFFNPTLYKMQFHLMESLVAGVSNRAFDPFEQLLRRGKDKGEIEHLWIVSLSYQLPSQTTKL